MWIIIKAKDDSKNFLMSETFPFGLELYKSKLTLITCGKTCWAAFGQENYEKSTKNTKGWASSALKLCWFKIY